MAALGDTLFPAPTLGAAFAQEFAAGAPWLLRLRLVHPASAVAAAVFVVWLMARAGARGAGGSRSAKLVFTLLAVQFALGIADVALLAPAWMQLLHLLGADMYWVALVLLAAETVWPEVLLGAAGPLLRSG
jgi:cytochrome c oxidase assembly protein subunit 15